MSSSNLQDAIRQALAARQPCKAKTIASYVERHFGLSADKKAINGELYGAMSTVVDCNALYEWSLKQSPRAPERAALSKRDPVQVKAKRRIRIDQDQDPVALSELAANDESASITMSRESALRVIARLRSGIPPTEGLEHLSVGFKAPRAAIRSLLDDQRWLMVLGDYGSGKTHFLQYLREISCANGFATAYVSGDSYCNALNHPQRFLPSLLSTLEVPGNTSFGYQNLIAQLAIDREGRELIREAVSKRELSGCMPFWDIRTLLWRLDNSARSVQALDDSLSTNIRRQLGSELLGQAIARRGGNPRTREVVYRLLLIARDIVIGIGCKGLTLLVDEAESIVTKLPNIRSRIGAIKVLSCLCASSALENVHTAIALTPDGHRELNQDMNVKTFRDCVPKFEPVRSFCESLSSSDFLLAHCRSVPKSRRPHLVRVVQAIYQSAYPGSHCPFDFNALNTEGMIDVPTRLIVRLAVDQLDAARIGG